MISNLKKVKVMILRVLPCKAQVKYEQIISAQQKLYQLTWKQVKNGGYSVGMTGRM